MCAIAFVVVVVVFIFFFVIVFVSDITTQKWLQKKADTATDCDETLREVINEVKGEEYDYNLLKQHVDFSDDRKNFPIHPI